LASKQPDSLVRFLGIVLIALVLIILGGTFYAVIRGPAGESGAGTEAPGGSPEAVAFFTGLGRLRIPVRGENSRVAVVLSLVFPYPAEDRPFAEELAGKVSLLRRIVQDYFASLSPAQLAPLDENKTKAELLRRFNAELRLGSIEVLFFNDFMILE
jgi:flagellar basal body-associated protein FliL